MNPAVLAFSRFTLGLALLWLSLPATLVARGQESAEAETSREIDSVLAASFQADQPGAAAIVVKDGRVVLRKGYGLANVELGTPMRPEMVFQIASVTKQFTATAILMLVDQGKVALDDDMRKYLPDFPDKGAKITIEHLLTHTSGIKSYTDDPKWADRWRQDMTPTEIIAITKDQPLEFQPGTKSQYNNTGYVILGAIIEKVSGMSYGEFLRAEIFEPSGMKNSQDASNLALVPNRASGYSKHGDTIINAPFLSVTQAFAAGSIQSTVDDLAAWDAAVSSGRLLTKDSWDRAFTSYKLTNGDETHYGYGWDLEQFEGRRVIRHSGGINGYSSEVLRMPEERVYVALLVNTDSSGLDTGFLATRLAAAAIGIPYRERAAVSVDAKVLDEYVGVYRIDDTAERIVRRDGDHLTTQRTGARRRAAYPLSDSEFFYKESYARLRFARDADGHVTGLVTTHGGIDQRAVRTNKPIPDEPVAVPVAAETLRQYVGEYELAPGLALIVTSENDRLFAQPPGETRFELFAAGETEFFVKDVDARITFVKDPSGHVGQLLLHQGGQDTPAKRVK